MGIHVRVDDDDTDDDRGHKFPSILLNVIIYLIVLLYFYSSFFFFYLFYLFFDFYSSSSSSFIFSIGIIHVVVFISASLIKIDLFFIAKKSKRKKEQTIVFLDSRFIPLYIVVKTLEDQRCSTIENK